MVECQNQNNNKMQAVYHMMIVGSAWERSTALSKYHDHKVHVCLLSHTTAQGNMHA